ncbi:hypothetical protein BGZ49_008351, partial [Haplosporangium sp. Z 27]
IGLEELTNSTPFNPTETLVWSSRNSMVLLTSVVPPTQQQENTSNSANNQNDSHSPPPCRVPLGRRNAVSIPIGEEHRYLPSSIFAGSDARYTSQMPNEMRTSHVELFMQETFIDHETLNDSMSVHPFDQPDQHNFDQVDFGNDGCNNTVLQYELSPILPCLERGSMNTSTKVEPDADTWDQWMETVMEAVNRRRSMSTADQ